MMIAKVTRDHGIFTFQKSIARGTLVPVAVFEELAASTTLVNEKYL